jgi:hypothetical protein
MKGLVRFVQDGEHPMTKRTKLVIAVWASIQLSATISMQSASADPSPSPSPMPSASPPVMPLPRPSYAINDQKIFWVSGPSKGGDTITIAGAFTTLAKKYVRFAPLLNTSYSDLQTTVASGTGTTRVAAVSSGPEFISFTLPAGLSGNQAYGFRVEDGVSGTFYNTFNNPEVHWILGTPTGSILGQINAEVSVSQAYIEGTLRIFGRNFGTAPAVYLKGADGTKYDVTVATGANDFSITGTPPSTIPAGSYTLWVKRNALDPEIPGGSMTVNLVHYAQARVISINSTSCGVVGDGVTDDTTALQNCLNQAGAMSGYDFKIVQLVSAHSGMNEFKITGALRIPAFVTLRGDPDPAKPAQINATASSPPAAWIIGAHHFGLSHLRIVTPSANQVVASNIGSDPNSNGHIFLNDLTVQVGSTPPSNWTPIPYPSDAPMTTYQEQTTDSQVFGNGLTDSLHIGGPDIRIINCKVVSNGRAIGLYQGNGVWIKATEFFNGKFGWYSFSSSQNVISENNYFSGIDYSGSGGSYAAWAPGAPGISQNYYTAHNTYQRLPGGNGEAFTSDGPGGAYYGYVTSNIGTHLTLATPGLWYNKNWTSAAVIVVGGHGFGQYRLITSFSGSQVTVDKPFDVNLDSTSVISITPMQRRYIFDSNSFIDSGLAAQIYGTGFEHVMTGNSVTRAGGLNLVSKIYVNGYQPQFYNQILNNTIQVKGKLPAGTRDYDLSQPGTIMIRAIQNVPLFASIIRGNNLKDQGQIYINNSSAGDVMLGGVIEHNASSSPSTSIKQDGRPTAVVINPN